MESTAPLRRSKSLSNIATNLPFLDSPSVRLLAKQELLVHKLEKLQYKPLPKHGEHIRILELHPGSQEDVLSCDLKLIDLAVQADYEPLSYVWGDGDEIPIKCAGRYISIKPNLFNALWILRHPTRTLRFWADAICINQKDYDERAAQVRIMQKVYARPSMVHVWLGLDRQGTAGKAFRFIERLNAVVEPHLQQVHTKFSVPPDVEQALTGLIRDGLLEPGLFKMLQFLFSSNPWIRRVWVQQEIGSARDASVHLGHRILHWYDALTFVHILITLTSKEAELLQDLMTYHMANAVANMWGGFASPGTIHPTLRGLETRRREKPMAYRFMDIMDSSRRLLATDEHDYIFAFLGHPNCYNFFDSIWNSVPVDYEAPVAELYLQLAEQLLRKTGTLVILSYIAAERPGEKSWVPRWSEPRDMGLWFPDVSKRFDASRRGGFYLDPEGHGRKFQVSDGVLTVEGIIIDTIAHMHGFADLYDKRQEYWDKETVPMDDVWNNVRTLNPGIPSTRLWHAFAWCLVAGAHEGESENEQKSQQLRSDLSCFMQSRRIDLGELEELTRQDPKPEPPIDIETGAQRFLRNATQFLGDGIGSTSRGLLGRMPSGTQSGDMCCVLIGAAVPSVLRETEDKRFRLIGNCYLHGYMRGEAIDKWEKGELSKRTFDIT